MGVALRSSVVEFLDRLLEVRVAMTSCQVSRSGSEIQALNL